MGNLPKPNGYETVLSIDGSDILEIASERRSDLIIMDIHLPGRSGLELTKKLTADEDVKYVLVVAVTAFAMRGDEKKIREADCNDYIPKPISVPTFLETVAKHLS